MIDAIAKHDIEFTDDKGNTQSAKAKQVVKMPKSEFDKLVALKAVVRADKDVVENAPAAPVPGVTTAAPEGGLAQATVEPVEEQTATTVKKTK